jgi:hypothetical protein
MFRGANKFRTGHQGRLEGHAISLALRPGAGLNLAGVVTVTAKLIQVAVLPALAV